VARGDSRGGKGVDGLMEDARERLLAIAYLALRGLRDEDPMAEPEIQSECRHHLHRMVRPDRYDETGKQKHDETGAPKPTTKPKRRRPSHLSVIGGGV